MPHDFLHNHKDFQDLIRIVANKLGIAPVLVEKDYWIMHCLYGLQQLGLRFELKGGTSLSKGFGIINRFSEDIDIRIDPPEGMEVKAGRNHDKDAHVESRRRFYDWLRDTIRIDGIHTVERDNTFDAEKLRSAGIRLHYQDFMGLMPGIKDGILLEVGFDDVTPNASITISSWAYDYGAGMVQLTDNRAVGVLCYDPGYTLVEKLQAISTKFRKQQETGAFPANFLRHYYDVFCLLGDPKVQKFIGTTDYFAHKEKRFRSENRNITINEAFCLNDPATFASYENAYEGTRSLYYSERPAFADILKRIKEFADRL
ncbi:nucleotidyl transferase AbiEii/AbiGii toxin family protein [Pseudochelatococcus sp. G4_1912]|uniref:nucleotidyl transferase AbiEii/AbiGii toxin family protein n=1 Tax=Pseudochelatococcus sp. G4_1912 TaxID=3114288 RepID=UPI0039C5C26D